MGMGEPLLNYEEVKKACNILMDNKGLDFSRRRITLSTAGIVPKIKMAHEEIGCMIALAFMLRTIKPEMFSPDKQKVELGKVTQFLEE